MSMVFYSHSVSVVLTEDEMDKVTIFKNAQGWHVRYESGPQRAEILRLFGGDTLPLPYTVQATAEKVVSSFRSRNPEVDITLEVSGLAIGKEVR